MFFSIKENRMQAPIHLTITVGFWNLYPVCNALQQIQGPPLAPFGAVSPALTMSYAPKLLRPERIFSPAQHLHSFLMLTPSLAYVSAFVGRHSS